MAVALPVGGDVDQLRPGPRVQKTAQEPLHELLAAFENPFEGDGPGDRPVVEEEADPAPRGQPLRVGCGRVDVSAACVLPSVARDGYGRHWPGAAGALGGRGGG